MTDTPEQIDNWDKMMCDWIFRKDKAEAKDMAKAATIAAKLDRPRKRAMLTRDGLGEYSSTTFKKLLDLELVSVDFRFTDLGLDVRDILLGENK